MDFHGKRVLVMGLGIKDGGTASARFACERGALVTVTDLQSAASLSVSLAILSGLPIRFRLDGHDPEDFRQTDYVIKNPGIRPTHPLLVLAREAGARILTAETIYAAETTRPLVGITGTKGKSLTTHLVAHLIDVMLGPAVAAGNNCRSPLPLLAHPGTWPILELSSWQLRDLGMGGVSPQVACWLNFFPDHLDHYPDTAEYFADKREITAHQGAADAIVLPWHDALLRDLPTDARKLHFSIGKPPRDGWHVGESAFERREAGRCTASYPFTALAPALAVPHWRANIAAALAVAEACGCQSDPGAALASFPGLAHRFERIAAPAAFTVVNDSAATTPESAALALSAGLPRPLVLIAGGGGGKNLDFAGLAALIPRAVDRLILFRDDEVATNLEAFPELRKFPEQSAVDTIDEAVIDGLRFLHSRGGGSLLLSPACSGAPRFPDLFVRGELFREAVRRTLESLPDARR